MAKKQNYLNNRDILQEINRSKISYCSFINPRYADYDLILDTVENIPASIAKGKEARVNRLNRITTDLSKLDQVPKSEVPLLTAADIPDSEVVFRVMTWEHIPRSTILPPVTKATKNKKTKTVVAVELDDDNNVVTEYDEQIPEIQAPSPKFLKVNFPPFQHYILGNNEVICVGKSHWKGDLASGSFSKDHGKITNTLALMYMKLCERYSTRSNWRQYSYNDEMRSQALLQLTQIGLQFDESKSSNPFAYYTTTLENSFTRVFNIEKRSQNIRDDILEMNNLASSNTRQNSWQNHYEDE
jgi:hypothetical protein